MTGVDLKRLLEKCNTFCTQALYDAAGLAVGRTHYEVAAEHFLLKCLENTGADMSLVFKRYKVDRSAVIRELGRGLDDFRSGNSARPVFSPVLVDLLEAAWLVASVDLGQRSIRSGAALVAYLRRPALYSQSAQSRLLAGINKDELSANFAVLTRESVENAEPAAAEAAEETAAVAAAEGFAAKFCEDVTAKARAGKIDAVFGRDAELRDMLTILARRRKNNPILVGEPGVGKTAVIEGLAKRIVDGDVPESLAGVTLLSLDMGLLEAGAGVKGEFERRLKGVIDEIKASPKPIILFIDEAHMLVGAGGQAGGSDAANLLKPALARGELRTCAATTWKEYKKYFEKDPALARRFQLVTLKEPDAATAALILRGLRQGYESAHGVLIRDDAVTSAAELSHRYISGRFLPDKAVDLLDTACAKVKMSLSARPGALEDKEHAIQARMRELAGMERDEAGGAEVDREKMEAARAAVTGLREEAKRLDTAWRAEKDAAVALIAARSAYLDALGAEREAGATREETQPAGEGAEQPAETETPAAGEAAPPAPDTAARKAALSAARSAFDAARAVFEAARATGGMVSIEVTPDVVAQVVSDWTGIPVGKMAREQAGLVSELETRLAERIKGQDEALAALCNVIKANKAGLRDPAQPVGVFLLAGPSGVGKTETGLALADILFGDESSAISVNMSEFQERHTVSRLIGSPPGYVGYGEGGLLTEAVRRRPYSVVLLDEVEKAHVDVMNLFYQVFDKGLLTDGEGKTISFANTLILLTSNLASEIILEASGRDEPLRGDDLIQAVRPALSAHFKPALLARMTIVPYAGLGADALARIARLKLDVLKDRLLANNGMGMTYSDRMVETIVERCREVETGARNIDCILAAAVLPRLARSILDKMSGGEAMPRALTLDVADDGGFSMEFTA